MNKWYMHNPESVLENETHKLLWDFEMQMDLLILARRTDHKIINKKKRTCQIGDFAVPADHRVKLKEKEKRNEYQDLARELKNLWNMKVTVIPILIGTLGTVTKMIDKRNGGLENKGTIGGHRNDSIIKIS